MILIFCCCCFCRSTDMVVDATAKVVVTATITGNVVVSHVHNLEPLIVFDFQRLGMVGLFNPELRVCTFFFFAVFSNLKHAHSLTHSLTHSFTHSFTHTLTGHMSEFSPSGYRGSSGWNHVRGRRNPSGRHVGGHSGVHRRCRTSRHT